MREGLKVNLNSQEQTKSVIPKMSASVIRAVGKMYARYRGGKILEECDEAPEVFEYIDSVCDALRKKYPSLDDKAIFSYLPNVISEKNNEVPRETIDIIVKTYIDLQNNAEQGEDAEPNIDSLEDTRRTTFRFHRRLCKETMQRLKNEGRDLTIAAIAKGLVSQDGISWDTVTNVEQLRIQGVILRQIQDFIRSNKRDEDPSFRDLCQEVIKSRKEKQQKKKD